MILTCHWSRMPQRFLWRMDRQQVLEGRRREADHVKWLQEGLAHRQVGQAFRGMLDRVG